MKDRVYHCVITRLWTVDNIPDLMIKYNGEGIILSTNKGELTQLVTYSTRA